MPGINDLMGGGLTSYLLQSLLGQQQTPNYMTPGINPNLPQPGVGTGIGMPSQQQGLPPQSIPGGQQQGGGAMNTIMQLLPYLISGGLGGAMGGKVGAGQAVSTLYNVENQRKAGASERLQQILKQQREAQAAKDKERQEELGSVWINPQTLEQVAKGTPDATRISASEWIKIKTQKPPEVKPEEQMVFINEQGQMIQTPTNPDERLIQKMIMDGYYYVPIDRALKIKEAYKPDIPKEPTAATYAEPSLVTTAQNRSNPVPAVWDKAKGAWLDQATKQPLPGAIEYKEPKAPDPARINLQITQKQAEFDRHKITTQFNEVQNKYQSVKATVEGGASGPADLALVYDFMKALDPTSVVRESEYDSAAKSGNIFVGAMARFNAMFNPAGGKLSEEVRQEFLRLTKIRMETVTTQYRNLRQDFAKRINLLTGEKDGINYVPDYEAAFPEQSFVIKWEIGPDGAPRRKTNAP